MFEHLDDPGPPNLDSEAVDRRIAALLRRRHHRRAYASAVAAAVALAGVAASVIGHHHDTVHVATGPPTLPACAAPTPGGTAVVVYDQPTIRVGWLPTGYRLVSGTPLPPNNQDALTYRLPATTLGSDASIEVIYDVGISSQQPLGLIPLTSPRTALEVSGHQASAYTNPAQPGVTYLEWSPQDETAVTVEGQREDLATLRRVADSITTDLGPPTTITATSYLGPVVAASRAVAAAENPKGGVFPMNAPVFAKLATYGEVMATPGVGMSGGTDAADGTPVWVVYDAAATQPTRTPGDGSFAIVNAITGDLIMGGHEAAGQFAWISLLADHQNVAPCRPAPDSAPSETATTTLSAQPSVGPTATIPDLIGLSAPAAAQIVTRTGLVADTTVTGETITSSEPPETVLAQQPTPGTIADAVSVTIAVPLAAPCTAAELALTYLGGGASAGSDGATLAVRDTSPSWCDLTGPLTVVGTDAAGHPVTATLAPPIGHPFVLSPDAPAPTDGQPPPLGTVEADIGLSAAYRDCPGPQVTPALWQIGLPLGTNITVANRDPTAQPFPSMLTCQGQIEPGSIS